MDSFIFNIQRFSLHDGPGIRTSVFYKGCPLKCTWCSNPESQLQKEEQIWDNSKNEFVLSGYWMENKKLLEEITKDKAFYKESNGGITLTGGEVLNQVLAASELLQMCRKENIHTACETSGFSSEKNFKMLMNNVDLFIMDVKHYDEEKHMEKTGVGLEVILTNLNTLVNSNVDHLIRIPVIPGFNDSLKDAKEFTSLLKTYKINKIELLPFHQFGEEKYKYLNRSYEFSGVKKVTKEDLLNYIKVFENNGIEVICN